jgi:protein O-mannosyl-transferase
MSLLQMSKSPGNWMIRFAKLPWWMQWLLTSVVALVLYWPILGNSFVADDHIVLKKVCIDKQLNTDGLFRPLSDITLYINYMVSGFQPAGYYIWNIPVHALDTVLLFHFCLLWKWTDNEHKQLLTAALSALLFLTYPFHSEPIDWVLGRGALMSNTFGMLALVCLVSNWKTYQKITVVASCYFIGMLAYESVMVLPAMVFLWLLSTSSSINKHLVWMGWMVLTLVLHFIVRVLVSGTITGDYGAGFFKAGVLDVLAKSIKTMGRLFLPPMADSRAFSVLFLLVIAIAGVVIFRLWKKAANDKKGRLYFLQMLAFLLVALLIPFLFGVSTHTSESDRFLHFPSFFFCILVSFCLVYLLQYRRSLAVIVTGIVIYFICFVEITNYNWRKASVAVSSLLQIAREQSGKGKLYVVNLPDEVDGAFIFRSGLREALLLHKLDTASVTIVNQMKRDTQLTLPRIIDVQATKSGVFIPPQVLIVRSEAQPAIAADNKEKVINLSPSPEDLTVFWNNKRWIRL